MLVCPNQAHWPRFSLNQAPSFSLLFLSVIDIGSNEHFIPIVHNHDAEELSHELQGD